MDKSLYIAMTSAKHNMMGQAVRSNNLANVNTAGFRADFEQARSMPVLYGEGLPTRAYAMTESPAVNYNSGALISTGRDMDIAVENEGFIAIQAPDGTEAYTRIGSLKINSAGLLLTGNNLPVMGNSGPITLPEFDKLEIGVDGTISIVSKGAPPDTLSDVDRIKLVNPDTKDLEKRSDGLLKSNRELEADADISIVTGFLEGSNVNPIEELTRILTLARQYEMSVKLMQNAKENSETSARMLQP